MTPYEKFIREYIAKRLIQLSDMPDAGVDLGEKWQVSLIYCPRCRNIYAHTHVEDFPTTSLPCPFCNGPVARVNEDVYNWVVRRKEGES